MNMRIELKGERVGMLATPLTSRGAGGALCMYPTNHLELMVFELSAKD
jgi:hypothetical protein